VILSGTYFVGEWALFAPCSNGRDDFCGDGTAEILVVSCGMWGHPVVGSAGEFGQPWIRFFGEYVETYASQMGCVEEGVNVDAGASCCVEQDGIVGHAV
jgi:hypothetical protein